MRDGFFARFSPSIIIMATIVMGVATIESVTAAGPINDSSFESISNYYARVCARLAPTNVPFADDYKKMLTPKMLVAEKEILRGPDIFNIDAPLHLMLFQKTAAIYQMANHQLSRYVTTNNVQKVPKLSVSEALDRAKFYLKELEVELPTNAILKVVSFGGDYLGQWEVRWRPATGGFTYDDLLSCEEQSMVVLFHEEYGFCGYACALDFPAPTSTVVRVTQEEAIVKASKVAPLVMKTPFYRMCRERGFVVSGVKNTELKIVAPNWLLDPARAIWIRKTPPEETRLCWIVTFETKDTIERKGGMRLTDVDIYIHIDAATGEVVGANFT